MYKLAFLHSIKDYALCCSITSLYASLALITCLLVYSSGFCALAQTPSCQCTSPSPLLTVKEQKVCHWESQQHLSVLHPAPPLAQLAPPRPLPAAPSWQIESSHQGAEHLNFAGEMHSCDTGFWAVLQPALHRCSHQSWWSGRVFSTRVTRCCHREWVGTILLFPFCPCLSCLLSYFLL